MHELRGISLLCWNPKETFLLYFQVNCIRESSPLHWVLALTAENWIMFREDQLASNAEIGGGGQHMEKMLGLEKNWSSCMLMFWPREFRKGLLWMDCVQKDEEEQLELAHRNIWSYIILKVRVVLAKYQWFLDSNLPDNVFWVKSETPLFKTMKVTLAKHSCYDLLLTNAALPEKQILFFFNISAPRTGWWWWWWLWLLLLKLLVVWLSLFSNNEAVVP